MSSDTEKTIRHFPHERSTVACGTQSERRVKANLPGNAKLKSEIRLKKSSLDTATECEVMQAVDTLHGHKTMLNGGTSAIHHRALRQAVTAEIRQTDSSRTEP